VDPRFGRVGPQTIRASDPLTRECMETIEDDLLAHPKDFIRRAHDAGTPFLLWHNTTRMHVWTHLSERWKDKTGSASMPTACRSWIGWSVRSSASSTSWASPRTRSSSSRPNGAEKFSRPMGGPPVPRREGPALGGWLPGLVRDPLARAHPAGAGAQRGRATTKRLQPGPARVLRPQQPPGRRPWRLLRTARRIRREAPEDGNQEAYIPLDLFGRRLPVMFGADVDAGWV